MSADHDPSVADSSDGQLYDVPPDEQLMTTSAAHHRDPLNPDAVNAVIVRVRGEVDGLTAPRLHDTLHDTLRGALQSPPDYPVILDLREVTFLGSAGLAVLARAATDAVEQGGYKPLRVVVDHVRPVLRPVQLSGLDNVLLLYHDLGDALAA